MNYTFKLARRIAGFPGVLTVLLALMAACASPEFQAGFTPPPNEDLVDLTVLPRLDTIGVGDSLHYIAYGHTTDGDSLLTTNVDWSATGGLISGSGLYVATTTGSFRIHGTHLNADAVTDSATVVVLASAPHPIALNVTPATAALQAGATQQFTATMHLSDGSTIAATPIYLTTGGTVSGAGLYTAPTAAGTYLVVAVQPGPALADTSVVTVTAVPPMLQKVILTPATSSLTTGATQQFSVSGQWSNGATTAPSVTYTATGGTITSGGLYTAGGAAGTFRVIATQQGGTLADTGAVTIATAPPVLQKVILTPATSSLTTGATQQFSVSGQWSNGATTAPSVTYTATGGTITSGGLYTAGTTAGSFRVIATQQGGTLADTGAVTITAAPPVLQKVILTPATSSLTTGATQQFSVSGQWSNGATTAPSVTYSATGGTITSGGLYTAGATAGSFRVIATQQGGTLADTGAVTITTAPPVLQKVILTPATSSLTSGATQQFSVSGQWSNGATTAPSVTYSVTGGTITSGGLYTAGATAGSFRVIATQQGGTLADTGAVTITAAPPVLQKVILTPATSSLATGATQQFSVSGQWSNGATTAPSVTYSATGGTITSGGLYTAGTTAGSFRVIATQQGGTLADTAAVTLTPAGAFSPPDIMNWSFEDGTQGPQLDHQATASGTEPSYYHDAAGSSLTSGDGWYAGKPYGTSAGYFFTDGYNQQVGGGKYTARSNVWFRWAFKFTSTDQTANNKVLRLYNGFNGFTFSFGHDIGGVWDLSWGNVDGTGNDNIQTHPTIPNVKTTWLNQWHWIEIHLDYLNPSGPKAEFYLDGAATPAYSYTLTNYVANQRQFTITQWYTTVNPYSPATGGYYFDNLAMSSTRIGLPANAKIGVP